MILTVNKFPNQMVFKAGDITIDRIMLQTSFKSKGEVHDNVWGLHFVIS